MNIKHAIGRLLGVKDSMVNKGWEDTVTFKELKYILEGLDEPTEIINYRDVVPKYIHEADCSFLRIQIRDKQNQIDFRDKEIAILEKKYEEVKNHSNCAQHISKLNEDLAIANGLVKNLESQLRVEGYRIEVKDSRINHLKKVLRANGVVLNDT